MILKPVPWLHGTGDARALVLAKSSKNSVCRVILANSYRIRQSRISARGSAGWWPTLGIFTICALKFHHAIQNQKSWLNSGRKPIFTFCIIVYSQVYSQTWGNVLSACGRTQILTLAEQIARRGSGCAEFQTRKILWYELALRVLQGSSGLFRVGELTDRRQFSGRALLWRILKSNEGLVYSGGKNFSPSGFVLLWTHRIALYGALESRTQV